MLETPREYQKKIILLLWCWWSARNKANAGERMKSAQEVVSDVFYYMNAWNSENHQKAQSSKHTGSQIWKAPPVHFYKINCDGSFLPGTCKGGWGFVIRDHLGHVAAAGVGSAEFLLNARHAEALACLKVLEQAALHYNYRKVQFTFLIYHKNSIFNL
jgi:hypothetical protein